VSKFYHLTAPGNQGPKKRKLSFERKTFLPMGVCLQGHFRFNMGVYEKEVIALCQLLRHYFLVTPESNIFLVAKSWAIFQKWHQQDMDGSKT
jgi:hypothetical protein